MARDLAKKEDALAFMTDEYHVAKGRFSHLFPRELWS